MKSEGKKNDIIDNKNMLQLIPPEVIWSIGEILTFGAKKYESFNWCNVESERYLGALQRHLLQWLKGEEIDKDSGKHHLEHMLTNAVFLVAKEVHNYGNKDKTLKTFNIYKRK